MRSRVASTISEKIRLRESRRSFGRLMKGRRREMEEREGSGCLKNRSAKAKCFEVEGRRARYCGRERIGD